MCMSTLKRRVQILLDPHQYAQLEREAARRGQSVAAVIRESITQRLDDDRSGRAAAGRRLLMSADSVDSPGEDWSVIKAEMEQELVGKLP